MDAIDQQVAPIGPTRRLVRGDIAERGWRGARRDHGDKSIAARVLDALASLGFAGAFRRSELVALEIADLEETEDRFKIIRRSKTDQEGHGETIAIARGVTTCPVKAVKAWLQAAGISEGPLSRPVAKGGRLGAQRLTDKGVCDLVKAYAERIGLKASAPIPCAPAS
jgi:integrase